MYRKIIRKNDRSSKIFHNENFKILSFTMLKNMFRCETLEEFGVNDQISIRDVIPVVYISLYYCIYHYYNESVKNL